METLVGVFRCFLPARYWEDTRRGAIISVMLTVLVGTVIGLRGFFAYASKAGEDAARLALTVGAPGGAVAGIDQTTQVIMALQVSPLLAFLSFFIGTPTGWLADYLVISGIFRGVALAVDSPRGDPILTGIDYVVRRKTTELHAKKEATERELAEGPEVPDRVLECKKFAGNEADYVVVASRRKEGWTKSATVVASSIRLRVGLPREIKIEGLLRTCYPLKVIKDSQVDRRVVHYEWPKDMPPLPGLDTDSGVWSPVIPKTEE